jgi:hypothetical protein
MSAEYRVLSAELQGALGQRFAAVELREVKTLLAGSKAH